MCQVFSFLILDSSVTSYRCKHFIIDAGHIAIESDLASKEAIHTIHQKRNQKYTEKDYKQLESLMYDKLSLRLQDAQVSCCYLSSFGVK
jgi:vacuolar protein sorting-associated protein 13A/C